ncbi:MAG: hypothetical protein FJ100_08605 [Deltaproteobacteria bacterium]|nr:hypothetical protein [Deltaproteobacteria bacterium]
MRKLVMVSMALCVGGCAVLQQIAEDAAANQHRRSGPAPQLPTVAYQDAVLVESPSKAQMAAYYCPQVVPQTPIPGAVALLCEQVFGPPPAQATMRVSFDLRFKVKNPNQFPIPVAELLAAAVVFPDKTNQRLGATCIAFCGKDTPGCTGAPPPGACTSKTSDIKSIDDFKAAAANLLIAAGISLLNGEKPTFAMPQVVQDAEVDVTARFTFGPEALLQVLYEIAKQSYQQLQNRQPIEFVIPYRIEGGVWFDVGSLGRVAVGYGPATGTWTLPAAALVPK